MIASAGSRERRVHANVLAWLSARFASFLSSRAERPSPNSAVRRAVVEWLDDSGKRSSRRALLQSDRDGKPRVLVRQPLPVSSARIREGRFCYAVEILSSAPVDDGFELKLEYRGEGRRREERARTSGPALLEGNGLNPVQANVVNVSPGGMQLFATEPVIAGTTVRISGTGTVYLGVVRSCSDAPHGYRIGVQFFGENRR